MPFLQRVVALGTWHQLCLSPQCSVAVPVQKSCPCTARASVPIASRDPKPCRMKGSAIHCCAGSSCFSPHFPLAFPGCKCTHISSGTVLLSPAGTLSPLKAPCPAEQLLQTPVWLCPHCSSPSPSDVPPKGMAFSLGPAQALI